MTGATASLQAIIDADDQGVFAGGSARVWVEGEVEKGATFWFTPPDRPGGS